MWEDFTKLYSVSKTLRFELIPTETTLANLKSAGVIDRDKHRHESFKIVKKLLDEVHRAFIDDSLRKLVLDVQELEQYAKLSLVSNRSLNPEQRKQLIDLQKSIYKRFDQAYQQTDSEWRARFGYKGSLIKSSDTQIKLIADFAKTIADKLDMNESQVLEYQQEFVGFTTYFVGYLKNRENCYTTEGKATEIAHRTIDQNLIKFYKNLQKYQDYYANTDILDANASQYFSIDNYQKYITQSSITAYNEAIGRLNSVINEQRQRQGKEQRAKLPMFEPLFKQILGDSVKTVVFEKLETREAYNELMHKLRHDMPVWLKSMQQHFTDQVVNPSNPEQVYLNKKAVNTLLFKYVNEPAGVKSLLPAEFTAKPQKGDDEAAKQGNFVSLRAFFDAIDAAQQQAELSILKDTEPDNVVPSPSRVVWEGFCADLRAALDEAATAVEAFAKLDNFDKPNQSTIKLALDTFNNVYRMYSYFELRYKNEPVTTLDADSVFYELFADTGDTDSLFDTEKNKRYSHYYDLIRNYLTQKPYSLDKWKLNFDCSQLLTGWDVNKEPEKHGAIFRQGSSYYLAIISNQNSKALDKAKNPALFVADGDGWQKMEYKLLPGANKMLPKCLLPKSDRSKYGATQEIIELYENGEFKKGDNFNLAKLHTLIDFYKQAIKRYQGWSMFEFSFKDTKEYQDISQFYHDVENGGYKIEFVPISATKLNELEQRGDIYLFRIANKDLSNKVGKTPNMHTLYFSQLFVDNTEFKLNGEAEVFFRPKSLSKTTASARKTPQGSDITENRRFTEDKIFLHVPQTINYRAKTTVNSTFNRHVIERIKSHGVNAVIGIDRGEKHLAYVSVVDMDGKLLAPPISLNVIESKRPDGTIQKTNYFELLKKCEDERRQNRQNWDAVRRIKDLKAGYIGHCVKKIVDLMIEHKAVVVLENLNVGFKQGRSAIERNVYSQLEQALLEKLQYIVDKKAEPNRPFGVQNGVQLAPPSIAPKDTGNHMGFVFYVDPSYTSAVDPVTGYRQHFRLDDKINTRNFGSFVTNGFDDIYFENGHLLFEFNWQQLANARNKIQKGNYATQKEKEINSTPWKITANVERLIYRRPKNSGEGGVYERVNPQEELLKLFAENSIRLDKNIKQQLATMTPSPKFVKTFVDCFNTINKLRNSDDKRDDIISPVYPNGFDSTRDKLQGYDWNGDANGAYNIARKGVILLNNLYKAKDPKDFSAKVTRQDYDKYIVEQGKQPQRPSAQPAKAPTFA